jgi:hypothetical protein
VLRLGELHETSGGVILFGDMMCCRDSSRDYGMMGIRVILLVFESRMQPYTTLCLSYDMIGVRLNLIVYRGPI